MGVSIGNMKRKAVSFTIILISLGLIISLAKDIVRLWRAGDRIRPVEEKAQQLAEEQQKLLEKKTYVQSEEFVEEEARNKLNMVKPGETVVILPPNLAQVLGRQQKPAAPEIPNWRQWWNLFFQ